MRNMHFTRNYQDFVDGCGELNYHEIYEMSQVAQGHDIIIGYEPTDTYIRLTPKQAAYFPKWIEEHLMNDMDADSWYGFQYAIDHDR